MMKRGLELSSLSSSSQSKRSGEPSQTKPPNENKQDDLFLFDTFSKESTKTLSNDQLRILFELHAIANLSNQL